MAPHGRAAKILAAAGGCCLVAALAVLAWISRPCPPPLEGVPFSTLVTDRDGRPLRLGLAEDGRFRLRTRLDELPSRAVRAVLRYEDRRFWSHPGVSLPDLARSVLHMLAGGRRMGGSTLTMQVARLRLGLKTGSPAGKLRQMLWALRLEWSHSKEAILEAYFNLAPYGGSVEGIGAAAAVYFHKAPRELAASEILALVPVPQNPPARRPAPDNRTFLEAAARLQALEGERDGSVLGAAPSSLRVFGVRDLPMRAPHRTSLLRGRHAGGRGRAAVYASLQDLLERQVRAHAGRGRALGLGNAAAMIVHWPSREVLAMTGSGDFFDGGIEGQNDGTACRRSPGSTLKPFIYALALEQGLIHPRTLVADLPRTFAGYSPENFDGAFQGPLPADAALRLSRNVPAISLASRLELPDLYDFLRQAGVRFDHGREHYGLALVLGGAEVTMRELAALYCMLADGGIFRPLVWTLPRKEEDGLGRRLLSPEAAWVACDMLRSPDPDGCVPQPDGSLLPLRLKTGTSNGLRDAWTCGIVGPYVVCVWLGSFDNRSNPLLVGAGAALPLFRSISRALAARGPLPDPLAEPAPGLKLRRLPVCAETGDVDVSLCPDPHRQAETWFLPGVSPVRDTGMLRRVLVNRRTLLRSCTPDDGESEMRVMEFWPTEFAQSWARAGVLRPGPPAWEEGCGRAADAAGAGPRILQPRAGVTYFVPPGGRVCRLPLLAHAGAGARAVYWFCGSDSLGAANPGQTIVGEVPPGDYVLRATDDTGRTSSLPLRVRRAPLGTAPASGGPAPGR